MYPVYVCVGVVSDNSKDSIFSRETPWKRLIIKSASKVDFLCHSRWKVSHNIIFYWNTCVFMQNYDNWSNTHTILILMTITFSTTNKSSCFILITHKHFIYIKHPPRVLQLKKEVHKKTVMRFACKLNSSGGNLFMLLSCCCCCFSFTCIRTLYRNTYTYV